MGDYRLPNGASAVLLSSDDPDLLPAEAGSVLSYLRAHPEVTPAAVAAMLFRTRSPRRHRALVMATERAELVSALHALAGGHTHPSVITGATPAAPRTTGFVFPGQGGQRPGMGRLFYELAPEFRAEADRCADAFRDETGVSPLDYLLDPDHPDDDTATIAQPALFTQMCGLAALWRSFGVSPDAVIGHSQGEIAAAYTAGLVDLSDAVRVVAVRSRLTESAGAYAMAILGAGRDHCEELLARTTGWAELAVINSPTATGISGDRATVRAVVDTCVERGTFARMIGVRYPAHTSMMGGLRDSVLAELGRCLRRLSFADGDIPCFGATLGAPVTTDLPVDHYWFWNLRNVVRFDKAVASAVQHGVDTFIELAAHPTLQWALQDNLAAAAAERDPLVLGTSELDAEDLGVFTAQLARVAVTDPNYRWERLRSDDDVAYPLLPGFPNTVMTSTKLWLPYDEVLPARRTKSAPTTTPAPAEPATNVTPPEAPTVRLLAEHWVPLTRRRLLAPRSIGIVDDGDANRGLVDALGDAAGALGARVCRLSEDGSDAAAIDTLVIFAPPGTHTEPAAACAAVTRFFGDRVWWPGLGDGIQDCWLVTVGGESVEAGSVADVTHAAISAGFRSIGAEHPGVRFRHLDLASDTSPATSAIMAALHTAEESELALRGEVVYAKRVAEVADPPTSVAPPPEHVVIIGGTGNVGLEFCDHYARAGARRITLVNRSGETTELAARLDALRAGGDAQITVHACDVTDPRAVAELSDQYRDSPAALIVHAAVHYSGAELDALTATDVETALQPKVLGIARVLDSFPRTDGCQVLLCSSIAASVGGRGMILYAAANRMLDALAGQWRAAGLDCIAVQWGLWSTLTMDRTAQHKVSSTGLAPMSSADALRAGLTFGVGNTVVAAFDLQRARSTLATCGRESLLHELGHSAPAPAPQGADNGEPVSPQPDLKHHLTTLFAGTIGVDSADGIDVDTPLVALGLDSLQALEFRRRVHAEFDHDLAVADLLGGASITDVLAQLSG
ncbi:nocobactin polyketide synthase NbtC [Mycobacterium sp. 1274756.6]|uniref:nocobactin polyketide synthase NbtC n=1 Tax=Mycobacterium sp. 1274756.6 TaxID=1834076 RepID=UPI0009ECE959|nr:nocobactin polyketide synthase NbtC [Mycobacterium sp. 1274756.6]